MDTDIPERTVLDTMTISKPSRHIDNVLALCSTADVIYTLEPDGSWNAKCLKCSFYVHSTSGAQYPFLEVETLGKGHENNDAQ
jgi:hypothetical protein